MDDLITRIKQEKWHMRLICDPDRYVCIVWDADRNKSAHGLSDLSPESAIIDAIREMDSR